MNFPSGREPIHPAIGENLYKAVTQKSDNLQTAVKTLNETSGEYRKALAAIDDKLIYLSAGSISLLLTFVGILFSSNRNVSALNFWFVIAAVISLLLSIVTLLTSRWLWSLYIFSLVHGNYLKSLKDKHTAELEILKVYPNLVKDDLSPYTPEELTVMIKKSGEQIILFEKHIKSDESKESYHMRAAKISAIAGYGLLVLSYALATLFFVGVIRLLMK